MAPCRQVLRTAVLRLLLLMLMPYLLMSQRWCGRLACLLTNLSARMSTLPALQTPTCTSCSSIATAGSFMPC